MWINWVSGEAGNQSRLLCSVVRTNITLTHEMSSGHLHTDMWNTSALPHWPGTEKRIMHDLAKQNTPQAWLCMALTFSLPGWCLFKRFLGACGAVQHRNVQLSHQRFACSDSFCLCHLHNSVHFSSWERNSVWLKVSPAHFCGLKKGISFFPYDRRQRLMASSDGCTPPGCCGRWYQCRAKSNAKWIQTSHREATKCWGSVLSKTVFPEVPKLNSWCS